MAKVQFYPFSLIGSLVQSHTYFLASIHWKLGNICKRKSYSFGVMPVHKTEEGENELLFKNLPDPFYAVDSRAYQFIEPDADRFENSDRILIWKEQ